MFGADAGAGVLLVLVAGLALALANSPLAGAWQGLLDRPLLTDAVLDKLPTSAIPALARPSGWIDQGLMAIFFFTVGLEIKREVLVGDLAHAPTRRLPVIAAVAGMAGPAMTFLALAWLAPAGFAPGIARGWAIPAATDIAFALGVLTLLGRRAPTSLRLFLLTVAVVDDLGAAAIIALVYSGPIDSGWLAASALVLAAMAGLNLAGVRRGAAYMALATLLWVCVLCSGIHPTVAGVLAAFTVPMTPDRPESGRSGHHRTRSLLLRFEGILAPWSAYAIIPLFGLANAGVRIGGGVGLGTLGLAVAGGLVLGKQAGIFGAVLLAERLGLATRPRGASRMQLWGVSLLGGIGFTMSLLLATLAFPHTPTLVEQAKLGILAGSLVSGLMGLGVLWWAGRKA